MLEHNKAGEIKWNRQLAYCVGILASDGNLSKDGRHMTVVSKDKSLLKTFRSCLGLKNKIADKKSGYNKDGKYYHVQFGNVKLYRWLNSIGVKANKSKSIGQLHIPDKYFFDFLRGLFDGDGCITSFKHPESRHPQIRVKFCSASRVFILWLQERVLKVSSLQGKIKALPRCFELVYHKYDSIKLLKRIYFQTSTFLDRKFKKAEILLAGVAELAQA